MKTVEELAKEALRIEMEGDEEKEEIFVSSETIDAFNLGFMFGYSKAKEWISVKDDIPLGSSKKVLGKIKCEVMPELIWCNGNRFFGAETFKPYDNITHWKYID